MTRPIKFRAWHNLTRVMIDWRMLMILMNGKDVVLIEGLNDYTKRDGSSNGEIWSTYLSNVNPFSLDGIQLMQFTGLTDKNGKEIFEGDVVEWSVAYMFGEGEKCRAVMEWKGQLLVPHINPTSEVIGNIYENPELIK